MQSNSVFVTGSSGFIGRFVCRELLSKNYQVFGFDTLEPNFDADWPTIIGDILAADKLKEAIKATEPRYIVHLAARCDLAGKTLSDYEANSGGVKNLLSAVRECGSVERVIITSSQLVCKIGYQPAYDTDYSATTIYGQSKIQTEEITRSENGGGVTWCIVRPTTVWGPEMGTHYQSFLRHLEARRYFHAGRNDFYKSYGYVENVAYQYRCLLESSPTTVHRQVFYTCDYSPISLRNYTNSLARHMNAREPITLPLWLAKSIAIIGDGLNRIGISFPFNSFRLKNIITEYLCETSNIEEICGPLPVDFEEGVKRTALWYINGKYQK